MLNLALAALASLCLSALLSAFLARRDRLCLGMGTTGVLLASVLGTSGAVGALLSGEERSLHLSWPLPVGELHLGLDPLSSFFLLCIFTVSGLAAIYGAGYLPAHLGTRRLAPAVTFFNLLVAAMVLVVLARDAVLLIVVWEIMSITSFFLVAFEHDRADVRRAAITYLVASQLGVLFLFILFALLGRAAGSYDFALLRATAGSRSGLASAAFFLALVGFGTKAGFWPLHIWLPDAHPAAPSHVSALMSGVMIKMGIYGLLRTLWFLGPPPDWWGAVLVAIGTVSGILGVIQALAQHDLKRLLAYHSVENIGIIALGIGVGILGQSHGQPAVAFLGYAGALLHVLNHGLFKALLFQGAGSVRHAAGTADLDSLGGLQRRMPVTGLTFLVGAAAICGLPPLNGFVSEWLVFVGAFRGGASLPPTWALSSLVAVLALGLIGGLAVACFVKAYGVVFLGEPRTSLPTAPHDPAPAMRAAMILTSVACVAIGLWPAGAVRLVAPAAAFLGGSSLEASGAVAGLWAITSIAVVILASAAGLALLRAGLLRRRAVGRAATWGCGYAAPGPRMQYTAASFASTVLEPFAPVIYSRIRAERPRGYFPEAARHEEHVGDMAGERILLPAYRRVIRLLGQARALQHGRIQLYLAYIFVTLIVLLVWQLAGGRGR
ncbi:MAG TPA: proton-conducting transporter membrane subunit [Candidatus Eisenbacteria bacterium]